MKPRRRLHSVTRLITASSILTLNRTLMRSIAMNKSFLKDKKNNYTKNSLISCGINRLIIIVPNNNFISRSKSSNQQCILSFCLSLSDSLYHIKSRIKFNEDLINSKTFYTLSNSTSILLSTIANNNIQKIVYKNGINLIFNFKKYFGLELKNIYDIDHLTKIYSCLDKNEHLHQYAHYIRNKHTSLNESDVVNIIKNESNNVTTSKNNNNNSFHNDIKHKLDNYLLLNQQMFEKVFPFHHIDKLRLYLKRIYNITNETFNIKMESIYKDIMEKPRIYKKIYKKQLNFGTLNPKVFEEKFFSSIFNKQYSVEIVTDPCPFYGILTDIIVSEQKMVLNINAYIIDEIKREVYPLYGMVNQESFKYFSDKKIGDVVECEEWCSRDIKILFEEENAYIEVKRLHQESLIYSLRNRRYVPLNEISLSK